MTASRQTEQREAARRGLPQILGTPGRRFGLVLIVVVLDCMYLGCRRFGIGLPVVSWPVHAALMVLLPTALGLQMTAFLRCPGPTRGKVRLAVVVAVWTSLWAFVTAAGPWPVPYGTVVGALSAITAVVWMLAISRGIHAARLRERLGQNG